MIVFEGNKKSGFVVVISTSKGMELCRSKTFKKKSQGSSWLGLIRAQLLPPNASVIAAAQAMGGAKGKAEIAGTELGDILDKHESEHAVIDTETFFDELIGASTMAMEKLAQAPATEMIVEARGAVYRVGEAMEAGRDTLSRILDAEKQDDNSNN